MRAVLISLDLLIALPILFTAITLFLVYSYSSVGYLSSSSSGASALFELYLRSVPFYNTLSSSLAYNQSSGLLYSSPNESFALEPLAIISGCGSEYACRIVPVSGKLEVLVGR